MRASLRRRIQEVSHPRLATLAVTGLAFVGLAGAVTLVGSWGVLNGSEIGFQLGVLGYLCLVLSGAGYLALGIASRLPRP